MVRKNRETAKRKGKQKEQKKKYQRGEHIAIYARERNENLPCIRLPSAIATLLGTADGQKTRNSCMKEKRLLVEDALDLLDPGRVVIVESSPE
jgi:hypothetical protein